MTDYRDLIYSDDWRAWKDPEVPEYFNPTSCVLDKHMGTDAAARTALIVDQDSYTYEQVLQHVCRAANGLASLGIETGSRTLLFGTDSVEFVAAWLGAVRAGGLKRPAEGAAGASLKPRVASAENALKAGWESAAAAKFAKDRKLTPLTGPIEGFQSAVVAIERVARQIGLTGADEPCPWFGASGSCKKRNKPGGCERCSAGKPLPAGLLDYVRAACDPDTARKLVGAGGGS